MKNIFDRLKHRFEGIGTQISRLDDETCKLDKCVEDVKSHEERYHGTKHRKLRQMPTMRHIEAIQELLRLNHITLGEAFFRARITEARFEGENYQAVDHNVGDQEDPNVSDKQEVKKADDQEIENVKDEEGENVENQQDSKGDDDTNNDDVGYMRQPIEGADHENNKSTQENRVLEGRDVSGEKSYEVFSVTVSLEKSNKECHRSTNIKIIPVENISCSSITFGIRATGWICVGFVEL
nr:hypothetical protein [Tanacetum cinerariifolium]